MDVLLSVFGPAVRWCGRVGLWCLKRLLFVVAVVTALGLLGRTAHAQAGGCSMPGQVCISGSGSGIGVDVTARQSGNGVPQTPSSNVMNVLIPITVGVAAVGVAAVAIPAVGTAAVAGDVMASVGMTAIRGGIIGGVALATLMNRMGGDLSLDSNGNVVAPARSPNAGDAGFDGYAWACSTNFGGNQSGVGDSPDAACAAAVAKTAYPYRGRCTTSGGSDGAMVEAPAGSPPVCLGVAIHHAAGCAVGYISSAGACVVDPNAPKVAASDAQIRSGIKAHPEVWPSIYNDMNCGPTLALTNGSTSDPCYGLYSDSRTGFGVSFSTGGSSWTNNGCAVNSALCPSATVTTAPSTDSQTKTNADGTKTTTNTTTTKTTTVSGTNDRTNPVQSQTTTTTSTAVTVTNPDGSTTTTTTTTTDQAPVQSGGNANQQQKDQTPPTTATFAGGDWKLYTPKEKTVAQVMQAFVSRVQAMPWYASMSNFFAVNVGGSCPHWVVPASRYTPALDGTQFFCGSWAMSLYALGGVVTMLVAAWYAWRIAFL